MKSSDRFWCRRDFLVYFCGRAFSCPRSKPSVRFGHCSRMDCESDGQCRRDMRRRGNSSPRGRGESSTSPFLGAPPARLSLSMIVQGHLIFKFARTASETGTSHIRNVVRPVQEESGYEILRVTRLRRRIREWFRAFNFGRYWISCRDMARKRWMLHLGFLDLSGKEECSKGDFPSNPRFSGESRLSSEPGLNVHPPVG